MANVIIIGAGHNGLVVACYLAKAGHRVTVFEQRHVVGGCCVTNETIFSGYKISEAAYVNSLFLPQIVEDLDLKKYGYEVLKRNPSSFTPPDPSREGPALFLGPDQAFNQEQIAQFSKKDAEAFCRYEQALNEIAEVIVKTLTITPPGIPPRTKKEFNTWKELVSSFGRLGPRAWLRCLHLAFGNPIHFLDSWFETDILKATLLTDAVIGATDFNGYLLLHHVMGEAGGARGVWGFQRGGMGGISEALAAVARNFGAIIFLNDPVRNILISNGQATGVRLWSGEIVSADIIVSNADPDVTFRNLLSAEELPGAFLQKIRKIDYTTASMKINLILSELPSFRCMPGREAGPQHRGTIHLSPSVAYIVRALREAQIGSASTQPILELTIPTVIDDTLAPHGKHIMNIFCQFTPYQIRGTTWDRYANEYFEQNILSVLATYIENMPDCIEGVQILSPLDLEHEFFLTEGNIFHGAMTLRQLFNRRPIPGYARYRTPLKNLYMCGAGTHPGGGVSGANGYNAAREICADLSKNSS